MTLIKNKTILNLLISGMTIFGLAACGGGNENANKAADAAKNTPAAKTSNTADPAKSIGIGPVKNVELGDIDHEMVAEGLAIFEVNVLPAIK